MVKKSPKNSSPNIYKKKHVHRLPPNEGFCFLFKVHIKRTSLKFHKKKLRHRFLLSEAFSFFFHFRHIWILLIFFILAKIDRAYHILSFETSFVKIKHICWRTKTKSKKFYVKKYIFLWKFHNYEKKTLNFYQNEKL